MKESHREYYLLYSDSWTFKKKVERSMQLLEQARETGGKWGVSYSGGKDSTVVLDLAYQVFGNRLSVVHQTYGKETAPGNVEMFEWAKETYPIEFIEHEAPGELEAMRKVGHFFLEPQTKEEKDAVKWWWEQSFRSINKKVKELGWNGHILGLRAEESRNRKMTIGKNGTLFFNQSHGLHECLPLATWSGRDVWAYIVSRDLKYNPIYDAAQSVEERDRLRNEIVFLAGSTSILRGQFAFWRKTYPDWLNELEKEFPEIRCYY